MAYYTIHITDNAYATQTVLANTSTYADWTSLSYRQALNDVSSCTIEVLPTCSKLQHCTTMNRILVFRDGVLQFGGLILSHGWDIGLYTNGDGYRMDALGGEIYLDWRLIVPPPGSAYDTQTGTADDMAKGYVTFHASSTADDADRRFSDLTVQGDSSDCSSWTETPRYDNLLTECQKLARLGEFDFRCAPSTTGFEFQTAYPQWGLDRTFGNGVNTDAVFSLDRRNYETMAYLKDSLAHYNYLYVGGQGEGADRTIRERSAAGAIATYLRREKFHNASQYSSSDSIDYIGDLRLAEIAVLEGMEVTPLSTTWKNPWDLGDIVTVSANRHGTTYTDDAKIVAIDVAVSADGMETVRPKMEPV